MGSDACRITGNTEVIHMAQITSSENLGCYLAMGRVLFRGIQAP
jgi:hypothetical protein